MTLETTWEVIQSLYQKYFNIPPRIVDLMAMEPILEECANGICTLTISRKFDLPVEYVEEVLEECLNFPGWKEDLDISPLSVYNGLGGDYNFYKSTIKTVSNITTKAQIQLSYSVCRKFNKIRKELRESVK